MLGRLAAASGLPTGRWLAKRAWLHKVCLSWGSARPAVDAGPGSARVHQWWLVASQGSISGGQQANNGTFFPGPFSY